MSLDVSLHHVESAKTTHFDYRGKDRSSVTIVARDGSRVILHVQNADVAEGIAYCVNHPNGERLQAEALEAAE